MSAADGNPRSSRLVQLFVIAAWLALAVIGNVILALAHPTARDTATALLPPDAAAVAANTRVAQAFPGTGTNAIAYLVMDGRDPLGPAERSYYDAAVAGLRADTAHVGSVLDWCADPLTAPMGTSTDGRSGAAIVWLKGEAGSAQAQQSLDAARSVVRKLPPSAGIRFRVMAPATTQDMPLHLAAWQGAAIVAAAALVAVLLVLRARRGWITAGIVLATAGIALAVGWPLAAVCTGFTVFSCALAGALTIGAITASTLLVTRRSSAPNSYRDMVPALALPGACIATLTAPTLLAQLPALRAVGMAALVVGVALAASLTLLPALLESQPSQATDGDGGKPGLSTPRRVAVTALVLAICALPLIDTRWSISENATATRGPQSFPANRLPDVVVLQADHDLRDPAGLIAVNRVSHRLMEMTGVRRVESAAWPGGVPWTDASLSSAAGRLSDQLNRQAATFTPQVNAIKTLRSVLDQVTGAVDELEKNLTVGLAGLTEMQRSIDRVVSGTRNIKDTTAEVSGYLDPVRGWMGGVANCPGDLLCSNLRKAVDPFDRVVADVDLLSDGADRIAAVSARTVGAFTSTPRAVAQMRSALGQLRSFVPTLETTIEDTIPQVVQLAAFLRNLGTDFADTGEGGFYMSKKALADPSYQNVRQAMFSADGTATRLFVYSDTDTLSLDAAARGAQLESAAVSVTKYGSLSDSTITVSGAAGVAAAIGAAVTHDAVLLAITLLAVLALIGLWRSARSAVLIGLAVLASYLAALGATAGLWQHLLGHQVHSVVAPVSLAVFAAFGVAYLVADSASAAVAPLAALGAVFGAGLLVVSGGSAGALTQVGTVVVLGLGVLASVSRIRARQQRD